MSRDIYKREFNEVGVLEELEDGSLVIRLPYGRALKRILKNTPLWGKLLDVSFKKLEYQRSLAQNRWLWGVAYKTICAWHKETKGEGVTADEIHAFVLQNVLGYKIRAKHVLGKEVLVVEGKSTSKLTVSEFNDFKEKLQMFWAERGCVIPDPVGHNFISDHLQDK